MLRTLRRHAPEQNAKKPDESDSYAIRLDLSPEQCALVRFLQSQAEQLATRSCAHGEFAEATLDEWDISLAANLQTFSDFLHEQIGKLVGGSPKDMFMLQDFGRSLDLYGRLGCLIRQRAHEERCDAQIREARYCNERLREAMARFAVTDDWAGLKAWLMEEKVHRASELGSWQKTYCPMY